MSFEQQRKKTAVVGQLLFDTMDGIEEVNARQIEGEPPFLEISFTKNPALLFATNIALTDTWNVVKRSIQKLAESDGICVVCFEIPKTDYLPHCPTCSEIVCVPCVRAAKTSKCPVCRLCLCMDIHKLKKEECHCP
jgi:hypothetical protein